MSKSIEVARAGGGIGFLGLLTVLFIGLKLTDHIDWSWWLVLLPLAIQLSLPFVVMGFLVSVAMLFSLFILVWDYFRKVGGQ